jgi:hypothetical protein
LSVDFALNDGAVIVSGYGMLRDCTLMGVYRAVAAQLRPEPLSKYQVDEDDNPSDKSH